MVWRGAFRYTLKKKKEINFYVLAILSVIKLCGFVLIRDTSEAKTMMGFAG